MQASSPCLGHKNSLELALGPSKIKVVVSAYLMALCHMQKYILFTCKLKEKATKTRERPDTDSILSNNWESHNTEVSIIFREPVKV